MASSPPSKPNKCSKPFLTRKTLFTCTSTWCVALDQIFVLLRSSFLVILYIVPCFLDLLPFLEVYWFFEFTLGFNRRSLPPKAREYCSPFGVSPRAFLSSKSPPRMKAALSVLRQRCLKSISSIYSFPNPKISHCYLTAFNMQDDWRSSIYKISVRNSFLKATVPPASFFVIKIWGMKCVHLCPMFPMATR